MHLCNRETNVFSQVINLTRPGKRSSARRNWLLGVSSLWLVSWPCFHIRGEYEWVFDLRKVTPLESNKSSFQNPWLPVLKSISHSVQAKAQIPQTLTNIENQHRISTRGRKAGADNSNTLDFCSDTLTSDGMIHNFTHVRKEGISRWAVEEK